ncbi:MAG: hypothetical protein Q8L39_12760 [Burkholderiales bacterium]|nr:hypothetical protein [Burkholderiales bacterium]
MGTPLLRSDPSADPSPPRKRGEGIKTKAGPSGTAFKLGVAAEQKSVSVWRSTVATVSIMETLPTENWIVQNLHILPMTVATTDISTVVRQADERQASRKPDTFFSFHEIRRLTINIYHAYD